MNRISAGFFRGVEYIVDHQIRLVNLSGADTNGLVSDMNMGRIFISLREHCYRLVACILDAVNDAFRYFASIGDKYFSENDFCLILAIVIQHTVRST